MRLTVSLSLWLALATASVLGIHGWLQLQQEESDLDLVARRELSLRATAIRTGVESAVRDGQQPDIEQLLEQLERRDPELDVFVFDKNLALLSSSWGSSPNLPRANAVLRESEPEAIHVQVVEETDFVASTPVRVQGANAGFIVLMRPRAALQTDLSEERQGLVVSMLAVVIALSLTLSLVVHIRLHRPLHQIMHRVRRLAQGEYSEPIVISGKDEIVELAREFDLMSQALEESRRKIVQAAESRDRLQAEMAELNRLALVGQLAASLAHEIGSPLQVLNGRARLLAARQELPSDARRNAEILVEQTDRITDIVERLLSLARRKPLKRHVISLVEPVGQVLELLMPHAERQGVELRWTARDTPPVLANAGLVQQVILNLVQNALHASSRGHRIEVTLQPSTYTPPATSRQENTVCIMVDDEGIGIEPDVLPKVFDPLVSQWREDERRAGTGLGLSVVKSIMTDHGGWVCAAVGPSGRGSRFIVHFPMVDASGRAPTDDD